MSENNNFNKIIRLHKKESKERIDKWNMLMNKKMRRDNGKSYLNWLICYIKKGGIVTHTYNYNSDQFEWFIATSDFEIVPLYGAESVNIIVPKEIKYLGGNKGHNNIFLMDDFITLSNYAPLFLNMNIK